MYEEFALRIGVTLNKLEVIVVKKLHCEHYIRILNLQSVH